MFRTVAVATLWSATAVDAATAAGSSELLRREFSHGGGDSTMDAPGIDFVPVSMVERALTILTPRWGGNVSTEEKRALEQAYAMSQDIAQTAISAMQSNTSKQIEEKYFPGMKKAQRKYVLDKMIAAQKILADPLVVYPGPEYQCGDKARLAATTLGGTVCEQDEAFIRKCNRDASDRRFIYVCKYWWDKFQTFPVDQAAAIFHEAVHHAGVTKDYIQYRDERGKLSLKEALNDCPSYEFLAADIFAPGTSGAQRRLKGQRKAASKRGGKAASKTSRRRGKARA